MKKTALIFTICIFSLLSFFLLSTHAESETKDYIVVGIGSNEKEAMEDGLWKAITAGMGKEMGDVSRNEEVLSSIKDLYKKDTSRYIRKYDMVAQKSELGQQKIKLHVSVDISTVREDSKKIIEESGGGGAKLPSVAVSVDNTNLEAALGQQFKQYGYRLIDFAEGRKLIHEKVKKLQGQEKIEAEDLAEATRTAQTAGANFLMVASTSFNDKGKDPVSGEPTGALTLNVKATDVLTGETLTTVMDTVMLSTGGNLKEEIISKAARVIFDKVNNHIISTWKKNEDILIANVAGVANDDLLMKIQEVLVEITGDENFSEKVDAGTKEATYRFLNKSKWSTLKVKQALGKIKGIAGLENIKIDRQDRLIRFSL